MLSCQCSSIPVWDKNQFLFQNTGHIQNFGPDSACFAGGGGGVGGGREGVGNEGVEHKVLTSIEYRAVSGVFRTIDPPTTSPPSECVLPPHQGGGYILYTRRVVRGWGVNISEDARR